MLLVGLTGSIGMGKSETAKMFRAEGLHVYDADAAVHALYAEGGAAVDPIGAAFPGVVQNAAIDREALSKYVVGNDEAMKKLEAIIHPLVGQAQMTWLLNAEADGASMVILDVPLLYETGGETRVDVVVVVSAPYELQRERVLARPGMTEEKFNGILERQVPDADKRARADFVIDTSQGLDHARAQVKDVIEKLKGRRGEIWTHRKANA